MDLNSYPGKPGTKPERDFLVGMCRLRRNSLRPDRHAPWSHPEVSDPCAQPMPMAQARDELHINEMSRKTAALRVFIADDSPLIRMRVASMLTSSAMRIVGQAHTPQGSIQGILAVCPDVVVLDVQLEGGSGLQVLRAVRHVAPRISFVVFSNSCAPGYRKCYLEAGAQDFLDKTHEFDQLAQALRNASQHAEYKNSRGPTKEGIHHVCRS